MSMSTYVQAIRPPDEKWIKMKDAYNNTSSAHNRTNVRFPGMTNHVR